MPDGPLSVEPGRSPIKRDPRGKKKPYRHQVGPMHEDMEQRDMPAPGEEDMGGNPLQEGILGDADGGWKPAAKRDEMVGSAKLGECSNQDAYPSMWEDDDSNDADFEVVGVVPHDEASGNPKKRDRKKSNKTSYYKHGSVRYSFWPLIAAGLARIAPMLGMGAAEGGAAGGVGGLMQGAMGGGVGNALKNYAMVQGGMGMAEDAVGGGDGGGGGLMGTFDSMVPEVPGEIPIQDASYYASIHRQAADSVGLVLDEIPGDTDDPEDVDQQEQNDGQRDLGLQVGLDTNDMGGTASGFSEGAVQNLVDLFPVLLDAIVSGGDPENADILGLHDALESESPGYMDGGDEDSAMKVLKIVFGDDENLAGDPSDPLLEDNNEPHDPHEAASVNAAPGTAPDPLHTPGVDPLAFTTDPRPDPQANRCPQCGGTISPGQQTCPQCGAQTQAPNFGQPPAAQGPVVASQRESAPTRTKQLRQLQDNIDKYGPDTSETVHEFDDGWKVNRLKTYADQVREGEQMANCFRMPPPGGLSDTWAKHPDLGLDPSQGEAATAMQAMQMAQERGDSPMNLVPRDIDLNVDLPDDVYSVRDPDGIPRVNYMEGMEPLAKANLSPKPEHRKYLDDWLNSRKSSTRTSDSQGPRTDEQKAAVAEFLQEQGREDEISPMLLAPWDYASELAEIQKSDNPPAPVDPSSPTGMEGGPEGPPGMGGPPPGMGGPPPGMGGPPPGMGGPPPGAPMAGPGAGMPPGIPMGMGGGGAPGGAPPGAPPGGGGKPPMMSSRQGADKNVTTNPAADQEIQRDRRKERDVARVWMDEDDSPLKVGREYEMRSPSYDIPDIIRVMAIKPESIEFEITSEFGLNHKTELTVQDARIEGITFSEYDQHDEEGDPEEDGPDAVRNDSTSGDQMDLSNVHITAKEAGAKFSPLQQKGFIDEQGSARNSDKLDLSNTHYAESDQSEDDFFLWL